MCDDCGAKIKKLTSANGGMDVGINAGVEGVVIVVPIYRSEAVTVKFRAIHCCLSCLMKRGEKEKEVEVG
jgi:hypothetical protein